MGLRLGTFVDPENTRDYAVELSWQRKPALPTTVCLPIGRPVKGDLRLEGTRDRAERTGKLGTPPGKVDIAHGEAVFGCKLPHSLDILLSRAVSGAVLLSREAPGRRLCSPQIYGYGRSGLRVHISDAIMQGGVTVASSERLTREFRHTCHLRPS
jgi:hypothetical protein